MSQAVSLPQSIFLGIHSSQSIYDAADPVSEWPGADWNMVFVTANPEEAPRLSNTTAKCGQDPSAPPSLTPMKMLSEVSPTRKQESQLHGAVTPVGSAGSLPS